MERLAVRLAFLVAHRAPGDVRLHADDRLDARLRRRLVERHGPVQRAVVGHGEAVEAVLDARVDEVRDPAEPVEQAELGVGVEVDEVVRGDGHGTVHGSPVGGCRGRGRSGPRGPVVRRVAARAPPAVRARLAPRWTCGSTDESSRTGCSRRSTPSPSSSASGSGASRSSSRSGRPPSSCDPWARRASTGSTAACPRNRPGADWAPTPSRITIFRGTHRAARPDARGDARQGHRHRPPRDRPPLRDHRRASPRARAGARRHPGRPDSVDARILLVEDDPSIREITALGLRAGRVRGRDRGRRRRGAGPLAPRATRTSCCST